MKLEPCPACGGTDLWIRSLTDAIHYYDVMQQEIRDGTVSHAWYPLIVGCQNCNLTFDLTVIRGQDVPKLLRDGLGYYTEGTLKTETNFPFELHAKIYIKETSEEGRTYRTAMQILQTTRIEELPEGLCSDNRGVRLLALKRIKELGGKGCLS